VKASEVVYAAHAAWNERAFAALLNLFVDDLVYWSNMGAHGETLVRGKPAFGSFLAPMAGMEGLSVPHSLRFKNDVATASVEFYLRDPRSGHSHAGTFRQVLTFRGERILRMDEYHDAAALGTFIALLTSKPSGRVS